MHATERRHVIRLAACTLASLACAPALRAQQTSKVWRIGYLGAGVRPSAARPDANVDAFLRGMRELGYVQGRNLAFESRFADGNYARLNALAGELVGARVDVLVAYGTAPVAALHAATKTIPIVIAAAIDPVRMGFAASFAHPGANMTGLSAMVIDLNGKHLDLLRSVVPKLSRVAVMLNPGNTAHPAVLKGVQAAAKPMNIAVLPVTAGTLESIEPAFAAARQAHAGAMIIAGDAWFAGVGSPIAKATAKHRLACISTYREHVAAGTLMSYGQNIADFHRHAASFVDKIIKGANPADLPIEQPTSFALVINHTTAKTLGLALPQELLLREDEAIE